MNMRLHYFSDVNSLASNGLELLRETFPKLESDDGVMLAGGRTPLEIYRRAAAENLSTPGVLFLSDERYVPVTDLQSNYGSIAPIFNAGQAGSFLKVETGLPIEEAAQAFDNDLRQLKRIPFGLLGLGADGHTASLFNLEDAALRDRRLAIAVQCRASVSLAQNERDARSTFTTQRISVTPTLLHKIEKIILLLTGVEKRGIIQTLLETPGTLPAGVALAGHPCVEIWTDQTI